MKRYFLILIAICVEISLLKGEQTKSQTITTPPGIIVNYSSSSKGVFLASPTIYILKNGDYIVANDQHGEGTRDALPKTEIFSSSDKGLTWKRTSVILDGQTWSNLFEHNGSVYIMGNSGANSSCIIRKSTDNGITWTTPNDREHTGLLLKEKYGTAPVPVLFHNNRIWRGMEAVNSTFKTWPKYYSAMIMSCSLDDDFMKSENWTTSNILPYDSTYLNRKFGGWLEGNVLTDKDGNVKLIMRVDVPSGHDEYATIISVDESGKRIFFNPDTDFVKMPGASKKFTIRYDSITNRYWTLTNYIKPALKYRRPQNVRNILTLCSSEDLRIWKVHNKILEHEDVSRHAFQYADWVFDNQDIIFVCRTAYDDNFGGADSFHNANYITFHRIQDFRNQASIIIE